LSATEATPAIATPAQYRANALARFWWRHDSARALGLMAPTLIVMFGMMVAPLILTVALSFWTQNGFKIDRTPTLANYAAIFSPEGAVYRLLMLKSLWMSFTATVAVVVLAYPMAYFMAFRVTRHKLLWIILITVPFWTSYLLRVFAWKVILGFNGAINSGLISLGLIKEPLEFLLYNPTAVTITLAHAWAAYAILPIYVSLEKIDRSLLEAATDLGDGPWKRFLRVTLPLSMPGTIAATLMVFIPTVGDYLTPNLVGGTEGVMIGSSIAVLYGKANNGPLGAALSIAMMAVIAVVVLGFLLAISRGRLRRIGGS
jgi:spermidine/putrescine transport system permease protein